MENLMICNRANECMEDCAAKKPHEEVIGCKMTECTQFSNKRCIPYKPEAQMFKVGDKVRVEEIHPSSAHYKKAEGIEGIIRGIDPIPRGGYFITNPQNWWSVRIGEYFIYGAKLSKLAEDVMENDKYVAACKAVDEIDDNVICGKGKTAVKKILAAYAGVEVKEERTYRLGDVFKTGEDTAMLSNSGMGRVSLVDITDGCSLNGDTKVDNTRTIPREVVEKLTIYPFTYIGHASEVLKVIEP